MSILYGTAIRAFRFVILPRFSFQEIQGVLLLPAHPVGFPDLLNRFIMGKIIHSIIFQKYSGLFRELYIAHGHSPCDAHLHIITIVPDTVTVIQNAVNVLLIDKMGHHRHNHKPEIVFLITVPVFLQVGEPVIWIFGHELTACDTGVADRPVADQRHKPVKADTALLPVHLKA